MCKPPTRDAVPIPGRQRPKTARAMNDTSCCLNCGSSLRRPLATAPRAKEEDVGPIILAAARERIDRTRFCTTECFYSHAFRSDIFDSDED